MPSPCRWFFYAIFKGDFFMLSTLGRGLHAHSNAGDVVVAPFHLYDYNPVLDLDASVVATIGAISQWDDGTGNNNHATQASASAQFSSGLEVINGLNAMTVANGGSMIGTNLALPAYTKVAVVQLASFGNTNNTISNVNGVTNGDALWTFNNQNLNLYDNGVRTQGVDALATDTPYIFMSVYDGVSNTLYLNGLNQGTDAYSQGTGSGSYYIGSHAGASGSLNGLIGQILVYPTALTPDQLNNVGSALATKWGV